MGPLNTPSGPYKDLESLAANLGLISKQSNKTGFRYTVPEIGSHALQEDKVARHHYTASGRGDLTVQDGQAVPGTLRTHSGLGSVRMDPFLVPLMLGVSHI